MVDFVEGHREEFGAGPICRALQVAPSTHCAARSRPPSARAVRDAELAPRLAALWRANRSVYGARKLWKAARRAGIDVGRDQVARLMRRAGIEGTRQTSSSGTPPPRRPTSCGSPTRPTWLPAPASPTCASSWTRSAA